MPAEVTPLAALRLALSESDAAGLTLETELGPVDTVAIERALTGRPVDLTAAEVAFLFELLPPLDAGRAACRRGTGPEPVHGARPRPPWRVDRDSCRLTAPPLFSETDGVCSMASILAPPGILPVNGHPLTAPEASAAQSGTAEKTPGRAEPLGAGWLTVTVVIGIMAALIALGGMALSFRSVHAEMVRAFGAGWAALVPLVADLTVFVFSSVDLVLARLDMSHPLARWTVYGATAGTVWLSYSAGGDAPGRVAHVLMPSIWVVFVELMRHVVRRQTNLATGSHREPIPAARWLVSPWPTLKLWRRMILWRQHSYTAALAMERTRLGAIATARQIHGPGWRKHVGPLMRLQIALGEIDADHIRAAAQPTGSPDPIRSPSAPDPTAEPTSPRSDRPTRRGGSGKTTRLDRATRPTAARTETELLTAASEAIGEGRPTADAIREALLAERADPTA